MNTSRFAAAKAAAEAAAPGAAAKAAALATTAIERAWVSALSEDPTSVWCSRLREHLPVLGWPRIALHAWPHRCLIRSVWESPDATRWELREFPDSLSARELTTGQAVPWQNFAAIQGVFRPIAAEFMRAWGAFD